MVKMPVSTIIHSLPGISWYIILSLGCVTWKSSRTMYFLIAFSMLCFMLTLYTESSADSLVSSIPMCLTCSCLSAHLYRDAGIIIILPSVIPYVTTCLSVVSMTVILLPLFLLMAIHVSHMSSRPLYGHHLALRAWFTWLSCIPGCLCTFLWHLSLPSL